MTEPEAWNIIKRKWFVNKILRISTLILIAPYVLSIVLLLFISIIVVYLFNYSNYWLYKVGEILIKANNKVKIFYHSYKNFTIVCKSCGSKTKITNIRKREDLEKIHHNGFSFLEYCDECRG